MAELTARHVTVTGRVQGVWFRAWTQKQANMRGISGWVRNRADGAVEAVLAGPEAAVEELIAALHDGPPAARVEEVRVAAAAPPPETGFHIAG